MSKTLHTSLILLVEDCDDDAYFFSRAFKQAGLNFSFHHARNGSEAVHFLQACSGTETLPGAIFLDLKMPVMNGFDVLAWIKSRGFTPPVPIVVLTGSDQAKDRERVLDLGAVSYLVKPIKVSELKEFLEAWCPTDRRAG